MQTGKINDSISYLRRLTQAQPDAQGYALLGLAYTRVRDYSGARDACTKSFEIQRSPETLGCVAGADFELKNYKEAAQIFDALDKNARNYLQANPQFLFMAAKAYEDTRQCSKAAATYKRLLSMPNLKKGTKTYNDLQKAASGSCRAPAKHTG